MYWLKRAVEEEYHDGIYQLAYCYYAGLLVEKRDYAEGIRLFRLVAEDLYCESYASACGVLGKCYLRGIEGVIEVNLEEGVSWYWKELCSIEEDETEEEDIETVALSDEHLLYAASYVNHTEFIYKLWKWDDEVNPFFHYQRFDHRAATNLVQLLGERGDNSLKVERTSHIFPSLGEQGAYEN